MMFKDKYIHKFYAFALAAVFAIALAGCGGGGGGSAAAPDPEPTPMPTAYEVAVEAIAAAETEAAAQEALATAEAAGITVAQLRSLEMAVADRVAMLAAAAAAEARAALVSAAACDAATAECIASHNALIAALQGDVDRLADDETATNAQQNAAQMALDEATEARDALRTAMAEMDRSTATGMAVATAMELAAGLEDDRSPGAIQAAKNAIEAAREAVGDSEAYNERIATAQMGVARAEERNAVDAEVTAATNAANGLTEDSDAAAVTSAQAAINAAKMAVEDAEHLTDEEKAAHNATIASDERLVTLAKNRNDAAAEEQRLAAEKAAEEKAKEEAAAMKKLGENLYASLRGPDATPDDVRQNGLFSMSVSGDLTISAPTGGPGRFEGDEVPASFPALKAGESAGSLGGWAGAKYAHTDATTKVVNEARVYNNKGPGKRQAFADALPDGVTIADANAGGAVPAQVSDLTTAIKGYIPVASGGSVTTGLDINKVMADAFTHSGIQNHAIPTTGNSLSVRGYYDDAPGEYRCVVGCSSTNDGKGAPSALGGTWFFKPDAGAMVHQPDTSYLLYGWWVNKNKDGEPMFATAFAGVAPSAVGLPGAGAPANGGDLTTLTGSATYVGGAAGQFAMNNPLDGTGSGGHFTANAELKATFGAGTTAGVTGTIDNFRLNGGSEDPGWSVALARGAVAAAGAITAPTDDPTVWSINGNKAPASGSWSGTMYDEKPGDPPNGDGSNIPTTVTGTFYSEFSNIGRMVGAFGADKQ